MYNYLKHFHGVVLGYIYSSKNGVIWLYEGEFSEKQISKWRKFDPDSIKFVVDEEMIYSIDNAEILEIIPYNENDIYQKFQKLKEKLQNGIHLVLRIPTSIEQDKLYPDIFHDDDIWLKHDTIYGLFYPDNEQVMNFISKLIHDLCKTAKLLIKIENYHTKNFIPHSLLIAETDKDPQNENKLKKNALSYYFEEKVQQIAIEFYHKLKESKKLQLKFKHLSNEEIEYVIFQSLYKKKKYIFHNLIICNKNKTNIYSNYINI